MAGKPRSAIEWPTVWLALACTLVWLATTYLAGQHGWWPLLIITVLTVTLHSSLQHEALHCHPTRNRWLNEAMVFLAVGLFVPYRRFKATHLIHHNDPKLTDPYEDPETNYLAPADWERLPRWLQRIREVNNTLAGRLIIGPALAILGFIAAEIRLMAAGDRRVMTGWLLHGAGLVLALWWIIGVAGLSPWLYAAAVAYPGFSLLMLRTFAEHQAAENHQERTCIVEDGGFLGLLFLNNNLHVVHHAHPTVPWYELPALYRANKDKYLAQNGHYFFPSYWHLIRAHAFRAKEPVPHPLMRSGKVSVDA